MIDLPARESEENNEKREPIKNKFGEQFISRNPGIPLDYPRDRETSSE
jgi:hypothetical protein